MYILLLFAPPLLYALHTIHGLHRNIMLARRTGLPYIIHPYFESTLTYALFMTPLGDFVISFCLFLDRLFSASGTTPITDRAYFGSAVRRHVVRNRVHEKYGQVLVLVGPGGVNVVVADADAAREVLGIEAGGARFPKATTQYRIMEIYGENVVTTEGKDWVRHRKFTTGPFNERNSSLVWRDSIYQTLGMIQKWREFTALKASSGSGGVRATPVSSFGAGNETISAPEFQRDIRALALHVISSSGFGVNLSFVPESHKTNSKSTKEGLPENTKTTNVEDDDAFFLDSSPPSGFQRTYRHALEFIIHNLIRVLLISQIPESILKRSPNFVKTWYSAREEVRAYLNALITNEKRKCEQWEKPSSKSDGTLRTDSRRNNLLSLLVRHQQLQEDADTEASIPSQRKKDQPEKDSNGADAILKSKFPPLNNDEILGNAFLFSLAGHETTASTIQFALVTLALNPTVQEWLHEQLDKMFSAATKEMEFDEDDPYTWPYDLYTKMKAPLCVMYETLRFFPPAGVIPRWTATSAQPLTYASQQHLIPARTDVTLNASGLHFCRSSWGDDAEIYDPSRWDPDNASSFLHRFNQSKNAAEGDGAHTQGKEPPVLKPLRGSWVPFSDGLRGCLGKKFAQVEFSTVITVLLRKHRVEILRIQKRGRVMETDAEARKRAQRVVDGALLRTGLAMVDEIGIVFTPRDEKV